MRKKKTIIGAGVLTAIASSLCCITPVLALISGTSGVASTFSWLEPFRPYLIGFTILVLGFAWNQKLKQKKDMDCACETDQKPTFFQSILFLGMVTIFAVAITLFPYYSTIFYPKNEREIIVVDKIAIQTLDLEIKGMTCASCEEHINHAANQLHGVLNIKSSYQNGNAKIKFDSAKTTLKEIEKAVNSTGYLVRITKKK